MQRLTWPLLNGLDKTRLLSRPCTPKEMLRWLHLRDSSTLNWGTRDLHGYTWYVSLFSFQNGVAEKLHSYQTATDKISPPLKK